MSRPARGLALLLATVLLLAPVVPFAAVGGAAAAPAGMSTIPDANVAEDVPAGETIPLSAAELEGGVMASQHADSLSVTLTTADHAASVMDADSAVVSGDGMAVVLRDDVNSAGREVALDAGLLQQALGYRPEAIYGTHEDGSTWTATAEYVDGYLVFDVPHFSSNTVTFSGEVTIDATEVANGTKFAYSVVEGQNISDPSLTITGDTNSQNESISRTGIVDGDSFDLSVDGAEAADVTVTFNGYATDGKPVWSAGTGAQYIAHANDTDRLFVSSGTGLSALDASMLENGATVSEALLWSANVGVSQLEYDPHNDRIYRMSGSTIYGHDADTGDQVFSLSGDGNYPFTVFGDLGQNGVISHSIRDTDVTPSLYNFLTFHDVSTKDRLWSDTNDAYEIYAIAKNEQDGIVYYGGKGMSVRTSLAATEADTGNKLWTSGSEDHPDGTKAEVKSLAYHPQSDIVIAGHGNSLSGINATTGRDEWTRDMSDVSRIESSKTGDVFVFRNNNVTTIDAATGVTKSVIGPKNGEVAQNAAFDRQGEAYLSYTDEIQAKPTVTTADSSLTIDGTTVAVNGEVNTETTETIQNVEPGAYTASVGTKGSVDVDVAWTERSPTKNPAVEIDSQPGTQTIDYVGTLSDGESVDLSNDVDGSLIDGETTVTVSSDSPTSGPTGQMQLNYSHAAQDKILTNYQASTFEESYNISHTFSSATSGAQLTIPFASSRVVEVKNVEYRVDGGSWSRVAPANYRLNGTTLDVYLDDATGGVAAGQTVDVRATGRKISVDNGKVTVTDPTAPGEELDTELRIDSRQPDFAVNVGPTDDGDRVHYAYSPYFPTEDYVIIQANGDQDLHLPNAVTGDRFRVRHLDTRVVAERGDVRIDVVEAGENPELDVSPGPGGAGDPVTVEYYNTETGVKYLLNSLTRSIVVDSDVAESPAIFEDDDSEDTWAILTDSGPSGTSSSSGAVGQFTERASGAVGSVSLPVDGSGLGQLALVGVLGLGGLLVLRRVNPFGGSSDSAAVTSSTSTGSASGSAVSRLTGLASTAGAVGSRAAQTTGSGVLAALRRLLAYFGQVATLILGNRRASITAGVVAAIVAARVGLVSLPEGTGFLIVVAGVPVATWLILRQNNAASTRVWLGSTIAAVILGLEFVAPGTVQTAIEQLTSETVAPLLILVAAGGLYLWYRARQSDRPQIIIGGDSE